MKFKKRYISKTIYQSRQARITNEEVRKSCGVENLEHRLRKMRLRWFGHVKRRDKYSILRKVMELEIGR